MLTRSSHPFLAASMAAPVAALVFCMPGCTEDVPKDGETYKVTIGTTPLQLKVSSTEPSRIKGLGGVATIADDGGMIFIFPDAQTRNFWMIDCITDMDVVFLDRLGYVTAMYTMRAEPARDPGETQQAYENRLHRYSSLTPAQYVIELRKGRATELGIKTQQKIPLEVEKLRSAAK